MHQYLRVALLVLAIVGYAEQIFARNLGANDHELPGTPKGVQARRHLQGSSSSSACTSCGNGCCSCPNAASCNNQNTCQWVTGQCTLKTATTGTSGGSATTSSPANNSGSTTSSGSATTTSTSNNTATTTCAPVAGMSVGTDAIEWWPFSLKQFANGTAQSCMPIVSPQEAGKADATLGTFGADVTVLQSDPIPWHIQLSSVPVVLEAGKYYTLKYTAKSSAPAALQVAIVQVGDCNCNWQVFYVSQPQTTQKFKTYTMVNLSPPITTKYLLNFDLAQAAPDTVFSFDDIMVCQQYTQIQATSTTSTNSNSVLIAAASESFEATIPNFIYQVQAAASAEVDMRNPAAANSGQYGAAVKIKKAGTEPWHIQLASQAVSLSASKAYLVQLALKLTGADSTSSNIVKVTWVDTTTFVPVFVSAVQPGSSCKVFTLPAMLPPKAGSYYLTIDMGLLRENSIVYIDDVQVYEV